MVKLMGTPPLGFTEFMEPPHAARMAVLRIASAKGRFASWRNLQH